MNKLVSIFVLAISAMMTQIAVADDPAPRVLLETSHGNITLELNAKAAPNTVKNFVQYVEDGFYNGTIFHRVIKDFMIQGGGFTQEMQQKKPRSPIKNEADNGLKNVRGSIAMARTGNPHSATAQFFINTVDNAFLNFKSANGSGWGYAVFGKVVEGMDTVDKIRAVKTGFSGRFRDVPVDTVIINQASLIKETTGE